MAVTESEWVMKTNERWATLDDWKRPMSLWSVGTPKTVPNTSLQYPLASPCRRKCGIQEWWTSAHEPQCANVLTRVL